MALLLAMHTTMADEIKLTRDTERAARAEALLRDEMLTEALRHAEKPPTRRHGSATGPMDTPAREELWQAIQIDREGPGPPAEGQQRRQAGASPDQGH